MDSAEQADGEKRVKRVLIDPLMRRGLAKPASLTKEAFAEMLKGLSARLAYMTEENLAALEEIAAGLASGKEQDRFPIANKILDQAAQIQPPGDDASPLIRAVFQHAVGQDAVKGGWSPELLDELRSSRRWPGAYTISMARTKASDAIGKLHRLERRLAQGDQLLPEDARWRSLRLAKLDKCSRLAGLHGNGSTTEMDDWA